MSFTAGTLLKQNLYKKHADIIDSEYSSRYFQVIDLRESYSLGLHYIGIRGSLLLKPNSEIFGEILDQNGTAIPLYLVNQPYAQIKGVPTLGFEIKNTTISGDAVLVLMGITRDNKWVKWSRKISVIIEDTKNEEEFGGFTDLPYSIPVEVSGAYVVVDSGSATDPLSQSWQVTGTGSYSNMKIRWLNHYTYAAPFITTQSQGSASNYFQSYPTLSKLNKHQLQNIDKYHVFMFSPTLDGTTWSAPPLDPYYYPSSSNSNGSTKGTWWYVGTVNATQGTASSAATYIEYSMVSVPVGKPFYIAVYMTTQYTLDRWGNNAWWKLPRGVPKD